MTGLWATARQQFAVRRNIARLLPRAGRGLLARTGATVKPTDMERASELGAKIHL